MKVSIYFNNHGFYALSDVYSRKYILYSKSRRKRHGNAIKNKRPFIFTRCEPVKRFPLSGMIANQVLPPVHFSFTPPEVEMIGDSARRRHTAASAA